MFLCLWLLLAGVFLIPAMVFYPYKPSEIPQNEFAKSIDKTQRRLGHKFGGRNGVATITLSMNRKAPPVSKANSK